MNRLGIVLGDHAAGFNNFSDFPWTAVAIID